MTSPLLLGSTASEGGGNGTSGGGLVNPVTEALVIEPETGDANNAGLRIESPAAVEDYAYVFIALLKDPDDAEAYLNLFNVDSAGEATFVVRDFGNGAVPLSILTTDNEPIFRVDEEGRLIAPLMPTADPEVVGALWSDAGTIKISAG